MVSKLVGKNLLHETTPESYMQVMRVNSLGPFLATKHGARGMKVTSAEKATPKGSIILTASVAGIRSGAGGVAYVCLFSSRSSHKEITRSHDAQPYCQGSQPQRHLSSIWPKSVRTS